MAQTMQHIEMQLGDDGRIRVIGEPLEGPPLVAWGYAHELPPVSGAGESFGRPRDALDAYARALLQPLAQGYDLSGVEVAYGPELRVEPKRETPAKR